MARQSMYVHGNAVVMQYPGGKGDPIGSPHTGGRQMDGVFDPETSRFIEWSDVVGLHSLHGKTFRGRARQQNRFFASVPTPTWRDGAFARLVRVVLKSKIDAGVRVSGLRVVDGCNDVGWPFPAMGIPPGDHCLSFLENVNFFDNSDQPVVRTGICIVFDVNFDLDGAITFNSVGCDFIV